MLHSAGARVQPAHAKRTMRWMRSARDHDERIKMAWPVLPTAAWVELAVFTLIRGGDAEVDYRSFIERSRHLRLDGDGTRRPPAPTVVYKWFSA